MKTIITFLLIVSFSANAFDIEQAADDLVNLDSNDFIQKWLHADKLKNTEREKILTLSIKLNKIRITKKLINEGNIIYKNSITPLMIASQQSNEKTIELLLEHTENINAQDTDGNTAILYSAIGNNIDSLNILLESGANPNIQNKLGYTPLMIFTSEGNSEATKALIDYGADSSIQNIFGETAQDNCTEHTCNLLN